MPSDAGPPSDAGFTTPRALHPVSIVLGIPLAQLVQALFVPAAAVLATGGAITFGLIAIVAVFGLVARVLAWQRFRYSFDGEVVRISSGVISRSHRSLDVGRIQQVELARPFLQRVAGFATIRIETAGSASEVEVELRVLRHQDAIAFRQAVRASKARLDGGDITPDEPTATPVLRVPLRHVALASVTGVQLLVFPALLGGLLQLAGGQAGRFIERSVTLLIETVQRGEPLADRPQWTTVALAAAAFVVVAMAVAVVVGLLRDGNFRIERHGGDLVVTRGLLGTRASTVPAGRVQMVRVLRNPLRRALGFAVVRVHSAGGSGAGEGRVAVPLLPNSRVDALVGQLVAGVDGIPPLTAHPVRARRRAVWRWLRPATVVAVVAWTAAVHVPVPDVAVTMLRIGAVALVPVAVVLAFIEYRLLGNALTPAVVAARRGALSVATSLVPVTKVQAVSVRANPFQRWLGLANVTAHVAGPSGDLEILDTGTNTAGELRIALTRHAAGARQESVGLG